ncbi:hypothetical protein [Devosia sp. Root685]|uniref:hypothetical protein n=1 Tax=Devosia sp. Root685 TaxID=1736587 RepID=UPI000A9A0625|nr:hypothetical protein [Devosia sp. Root685]
MAKKQNSREHHWWPVGLQKHWTDRTGNISWVNPSGMVTKKKSENRKVAKKAHGHTVLLNGPWTTNFEDDFESADNSVHQVITSLDLMPARGSRSIKEFISLMGLLRKRDRTLSDMCSFYEIKRDDLLSLARLIMSLLIRLPARRHKYEHVPEWFDLPPDENIGKMNIRQFYRIARDSLERDSNSNLFFILIRSPWKEFLHGDGVLDWMTDNLVGLRIRGRALVPLTPKLCVYMCTPSRRSGLHNCASFLAAPWIVEAINEITQVYSKDHLFFRSKKPPRLTENFSRGEFLSHEKQRDSLIALLDEIAEGGKRSSSTALFQPH